MSRSLVNTLLEIGVLMDSEKVSFVAVGASFTADTTRVKFPVDVPPRPSLTVYSIAGTIPL